MTEIYVFQILLYLLVLLILIKPLGWYMAQVYQGKFCGLDRLLGPFERLIHRFCNIHPEQEMGWKSYLLAMLIFNFIGIVLTYAIQRLQAYLPLNPQNFPAVPPTLAFNTAISFTTNTNWQAYSGETSLSYLTQMLALTVQNFVSAATGMALLMALIRGIARHEGHALGNFWVDMIRSVLYILLPLALLFAVFLSSQGVIQNFKPYQKASLIQPITSQKFTTEQAVITEQIIPMGPVASQVAIKQLGTNGGGFFNTNAAHPFENPTPLTNFFEMLAILLIPAALCYTFGVMINDTRQAWAIILTLFIIFIPLATVAIIAEQKGNPAFAPIGIAETAERDIYPGGNMEGKEVRFGIANSAFWAAATTATSNGSSNAMYDSFTPLGGLVPLFLMHLGEVIFGGVGSGLYGLLVMIIITVFIAGLMVGRTPEYLGKKIEPFEMKMASIMVLLMPFLVLIFTAFGVGTKSGAASILNAGPHGFTEVLYAFTSMSNNNGSSFAGLNSKTPFYTILGSIAMLLGRYWMAIPVLAIAGSLVKKKAIPSNAGTLPTHTVFFGILLLGIILIIGALSFLPALILGPIVEQLMVTP